MEASRLSISLGTERLKTPWQEASSCPNLRPQAWDIRAACRRLTLAFARTLEARCFWAIPTVIRSHKFLMGITEWTPRGVLIIGMHSPAQQTPPRQFRLPLTFFINTALC